MCQVWWAKIGKKHMQEAGNTELTYETVSA